jgi:hypothetical protein
MRLDKQRVVDFIERRAGASRAQMAARQLPDPVDLDHHVALLQHLGVEPRDLASQLGNTPRARSQGHAPSKGPGTEGTVNGTEDDYEGGAGASRTRARI